MEVTVVIVNWNTRDELAMCLDSLLAQQGVENEIIVVDNASCDGSVEMVQTNYPSVKLIANKSNLGFGAAQNQGIEQSSGRYVFALNPDVVFPTTDILAKMVKFADEHPDYGLIGPRIENPDGTLHFSARRFPTLGTGVFRRTPIGRLFPNNRYVREYILSDWDHNEPREVDWLSGAALLVRRDMLDEIGLFDTRFYMYCEDVDLAYRAKQCGWKAVYYPAVTVIHRIGAASDKAPFRMIYHFHRSMFRFYLKHYARGAGWILLPVVAAGVCARAIFIMLLALRPRKENGERRVH